MLGCIQCGNKAIEQRDLMLCSSCNRERRKPPAKPKPKTPIRAVSKKKALALVKLKAAKVEKRKEEVNFCEGCGETGTRLSHSHILSVANYPHLESDPENITMECIGTNSCHMITETGDLAAQERLANWPKKLKYILKHAPGQLEKIKLRSLKKL